MVELESAKVEIVLWSFELDPDADYQINGEAGSCRCRLHLHFTTFLDSRCFGLVSCLQRTPSSIDLTQPGSR